MEKGEGDYTEPAVVSVHNGGKNSKGHEENNAPGNGKEKKRKKKSLRYHV